MAKYTVEFKTKDGKFELLGGLNYDYCKPFNPADFNIAKDIKDYEE